MEQITVSDIVKATGGRLLCGEENLTLSHISTNSKEMAGADLFVPLIGERVDAHRFIAGAFEAGAVATLTSEHDAMDDVHPWIRVEDTKKALQAIGVYLRERLHIPLVGVTGSVGKTTTREMIATALSAKYQVFKTPGNANSQIGVPITISEISSQDEVGVLELGMSLPGELTVIAQIARVDMAVITNIGVAHIEQLGSQENIRREKLTIQDGMPEGGLLILNGDDPLLKDQKARDGLRTVYYGTGEKCQYRAEDIVLEDGCPSFVAVCNGKRIPVRLSVMGRHHVLDAMSALAVADACGVPLEKAFEKLSEFHGFKNRQQIYRRADGVTVIDDTYNASPASMMAGLEVLDSMKSAKRHIAVLADMKELGEQSPRFHREIGTFLADHPVDVLFTFGELAREIEEGAKEANVGCDCHHFDVEEREALFEAVAKTLQPGDCVLLKGSNSMKLQELASQLLK